jgi:hypothetical protein
MVREVLGREEIHVAEAPTDSSAKSIGQTTPEFLNACCQHAEKQQKTKP